MPKALIIEDDQVTRVLMRKMLEHIDYEVDEAQNGIEGLANIEKSKYDVILLDIHMPEMDGIQMMTVVKERKLTLPVIVVSAYAVNEGKNKLLELGVNLFLHKPFDIKDFYEMIERVKLQD